MLTTYSNQTDIPDDLKPHYSKREDGKWHADIPDEHPAIKNNAKLLSDKSAAESKATKLESDLESARAGNLGRGQVATTKADIDRLAKFDALALTPEQITAKLDEHKTLAEKDQKRTRDDSLRQLAKDYGYNEEAFVRLPGLPDFESRAGKDGKTEWFAKLVGADKVVSEKPAKEWIEASPDIKPFMASLTQKTEGVRVPTTGPTVQPVETDQFKWAKEYAKAYTEQSQPVADPFKAFNERTSAA